MAHIELRVQCCSDKERVRAQAFARTCANMYNMNVSDETINRIGTRPIKDSEYLPDNMIRFPEDEQRYLRKIYQFFYKIVHKIFR